MASDDFPDPSTPAPALITTHPPDRPADEWAPAEVEGWVRGAMHQDRTPGPVVIVAHPLRTYKVPRGLYEALERAGCTLTQVDTQPDRVTSVRGIRDALLRASEQGERVDILVMSGDGSLDHHVLVAAFWAFYPDLVRHREGLFKTEPAADDELAQIPVAYRDAFLTPWPTGAGLAPTEAMVHELWALRARIAPLLRRERSVSRITRRADRHERDPLLRLAVLAALLPHRVVLRPEGFDLSGLARATRERTFQGLYPFVRAIAAYPAGTAADNALYAGVPGWLYAQASRVLTRFARLDGLRRRWERRTIERFVSYFLRSGVVVPARFSLIAFDDDWQAVSSHAAGGPGSGGFFAADLESKTGGLLGYFLRIPSVVIGEGLLGSTIVRLRVRDGDGRVRSVTEQQMAEGLYTNRTFIAGVGSIPSTNPTSFAGQSSLIIAPPIWGRDDDGALRIDLRGLGTFIEGMVKGVLARTLHLLGFNVGTLAGGGKFSLAAPEHQVTLKEGEEVDIRYLTRARRPRFVATQVSGDPYQAWAMTVRVAWGPLPLLAAEESLLMASARRSLAHLRVEQTYRLGSVYIGGLRYFRHRVGQKWTPALADRTGLAPPPTTLPRRLTPAQQVLLDRWQALDTGAFLDTSERGVQLGRKGRYAHTNDHTAHLVLARERGTLLVRMMRAMPAGIFEARYTYRAFGAFWILHDTELRHLEVGEPPRVLQEEHYFRSAEAFRQEAPTFFPFVAADEGARLSDITEEVDR